MKKLFIDKKFLEIFILAMISGMPLSLIYSTLGAWLKEGNIPIEIITTFAVARMPYSLKFLWAPWVDYIKIPFLTRFGHRKSWLIFCCLLSSVILFGMSFINLSHNLSALYILAITLGVSSATYDINVNALRIEKFSTDLQGQISAISVMGYRVGMLIAASGALEISYILSSWPTTFRILSVVFLIATVYIVSIKEEEITREETYNTSNNSFSDLLIKPFKDFLLREGALFILAIVMFFKMGDAMVGSVTVPFYLEMGFSKQQIAVSKALGLIPMLLGSYAGGWVIDRLGVFKGLIITSIVQCLKQAAFIWLFYSGISYPTLFFVISIENLIAGMGSSAIVAYLSILCNKKYSAPQYAFLNSACLFFNNTITIYAGQLVKNMGWVNYFIFTILLALPALILLFYMNKRFSSVSYVKKY